MIGESLGRCNIFLSVSVGMLTAVDGNCLIRNIDQIDKDILDHARNGTMSLSALMMRKVAALGQNAYVSSGSGGQKVRIFAVSEYLFTRRGHMETMLQLIRKHKKEESKCSVEI